MFWLISISYTSQLSESCSTCGCFNQEANSDNYEVRLNKDSLDVTKLNVDLQSYFELFDYQQCVHRLVTFEFIDFSVLLEFVIVIETYGQKSLKIFYLDALNFVKVSSDRKYQFCISYRLILIKITSRV